MATEPATGIWRDGKTQTIRDTEGQHLWLVYHSVIGLPSMLVAQRDRISGGFWSAHHQRVIYWKDVIHYARINYNVQHRTEPRELESTGHSGDVL